MEISNEDLVEAGLADGPEYTGRKGRRSKHKDKKEVKQTPDTKILEHLAKLETYYDEIKLTDDEKTVRRIKHIDWIKQKLAEEFVTIDHQKEVFIKKVDGGVEDGPTLYHAINSGSGIRYSFVVPRDYKDADEARPVVAKMAAEYLNLWKHASDDFKKRLNT
jgi:hypothetical protein